MFVQTSFQFWFGMLIYFSGCGSAGISSGGAFLRENTYSYVSLPDHEIIRNEELL